MRKKILLTFFILTFALALHAEPQPQATGVAKPVLPAPTLPSDTTTAAVPGVAVPTPPPPAAASAPAENTDPLLEGFFEDIQYSPSDKRDPFLPYFISIKQRMSNDAPTGPLEPLQQFALSELKIVGIIWDVGHPKALVLDSKGVSHIVVENSKIGKDAGYVAAIREGEIIVVEPIQDNEGKKGYQTKVLKLTGKK